MKNNNIQQQQQQSASRVVWRVIKYTWSTTARECAAVRGSARECAGVCRSARECAGVRGSARECAAVRGSAQECAGVCGSARECAGVCRSARECAGVRGSVQECAGVHGSNAQFRICCVCVWVSSGGKHCKNSRPEDFSLRKQAANTLSHAIQDTFKFNRLHRSGLVRPTVNFPIHDPRFFNSDRSDEEFKMPSESSSCYTHKPSQTFCELLKL